MRRRPPGGPPFWANASPGGDYVRVRRPLQRNSRLVRALPNATPRARACDAASRYLGSDEQGREVFKHVAGGRPSRNSIQRSQDETLAVAGRLIRRDSTTRRRERKSLLVEAKTSVTTTSAPCNFVFRESKPVGIIELRTLLRQADASEMSATHASSELDARHRMGRDLPNKYAGSSSSVGPMRLPPART